MLCFSLKILLLFVLTSGELIRIDTYKNFEFHPLKSDDASSPEKGSLNSTDVIYDFEHLGMRTSTGLVRGSVFTLHNPIGRFSIHTTKGPGSCQVNTRRKPSETAHAHHCHVSTNGGFFNVQDGTCLGNVVEDGLLIQPSRWRTPVFGILASGEAVIGYIGEAFSLNTTSEAMDISGKQVLQMVSGLIWLVRDGRNNVRAAVEQEDPRAQTTGSLQYFAEVRSARTALGIDTQGRIILVVVEGKTGVDGTNLIQLADVLIDLGVVSAINLDGGGSSIAVSEDILVNAPSDECQDHTSRSGKHVFLCERAVTTITCFHDRKQ